MKYYLIAGEASGDLHASHLMAALLRVDDNAEFRFFGGDMMRAVGGTCVRHYRDTAYMGFWPVLAHLPAILGNMRMCRRDIAEWRPDAVILVDYPGFNLDIARFVHARTDIPVYYYIAPKLWAWKEWRIRRIRRDVDEILSILPFEVDFFERKHHFPIHYVGNPTAEEVRQFRESYAETAGAFRSRHGLTDQPIIALLAGSRRQEISANLPQMIEAARRFGQCQMVLAGAPGIDRSFYAPFVGGTGVSVVYGETYELLAHARAAVVTSGTATLETALLGVPQAVCYATPLPRLMAWLRRRVLKVRYISLVNLIAGREVVPELVADTFSADNIAAWLERLLPEGDARQSMLGGYADVWRRLGDSRPSEDAAHIIYQLTGRQ